MSSYHTLPPGLVRSLGGAGDRAEIELLCAGQVSRRLVQLRAILDLVRRDAPDAGQTAGLWDSFATLADVQRCDPGTVAAVLGGPQAGAWAARCLRVLSGAPSAAPLWVHLAHLGAITATAAVRSGVPVEVQVPVRAGVVALPALGRATLDRTEPWGLAACTPGDPVLLDGLPPPEWSPVPLLVTGPLAVPLDNADPYWDCFGLPVATALDEPAVERWRRQWADAWAILARRHPHRLAVLSAAVRCLIPLGRGGRLGGTSASSRDSPGAVALTEPAGPDRFAATLVHEVQHFRLNALHDLVPLHRKASELLYSPWRNDPRALPGVLHGAVAFHALADFWGRERSTAGRGAELMYARTVRQLDDGCRILDGRSELTPAGRTLVEALTAAVGRLPRSGIGAEVSRLAADLVAQHRALWRLRNVVPEPASVSAAEKRLRGERITGWATAAGRMTATAPPGGDSPLFRLAVAWVEDPDRVRADAADPDTFAERHPGAATADLPLLAGDYAGALAVRLAQVDAGATDDGTWAALSVAHGRLRTEPDSSPLAARPELVRAAWARVTESGGKPLVELLFR